ncbi:N-acetylmuramoyl-L-alanine amidase [Lacipirellula sp.]|uniref:N-acetylmuramoyl-L-alanine amidase n=1 Tax=Lacipirellula sp. TaxID=2691419 RepID=UPI003D09D5A5
MRYLASALFAAASLTFAVQLHAAEVGEQIERTGDEIMVCGQLFHTTAPVVLWTDPKGYDAYRTERRFGPIEKSTWEETIKELPEMATNGPARYGIRTEGLAPVEIEEVRGGGWPLPLLQRTVDQFVLHYDVCPVSETCFKVLHDHRNLSVHFMLDVDGTIYQTLDLKERARHATISNARSIGIEIANMGAYGVKNKDALMKWYEATDGGEIRLRPAKAYDELGVRTPSFVGKPARQELIVGNIQGQDLAQYDFTPEQYESLIKLTATLCKIFPKINCDYPKDADGKLVSKKLSDEEWKAYQGVMGHYHVQLNKTDPGPAFDWEKVIGGAQKLMKK